MNAQMGDQNIWPALISALVICLIVCWFIKHSEDARDEENERLDRLAKQIKEEKACKTQEV